MSDSGVFLDPSVIGADSLENARWSANGAARRNAPGHGADEDLIGSGSLHDWPTRVTAASGNSSGQWSSAEVRVVDESAVQAETVDRVSARLDRDGGENGFLEDGWRNGATGRSPTGKCSWSRWDRSLSWKTDRAD